MLTGSDGGQVIFLALLVVLPMAFIGCGGGEDEANQRGTAAMQRGEYAQAVEEFTKVVEAQPNSSGAFRNRGEAYLALASQDPGVIVKAIADYTSALELDPVEQERAFLYQRRGRAYIVSGRPDLAEADLTEASKIISNDAEIYSLRAECRLKQGKAKGTAEDLKQVERLATANPLLFAKLAEMYAAIGYLDDALAASDRYLESAEPAGKHIGHRMRGHIFLRQQNYAKAIEEYSGVIAQQPKDKSSYRQRGAAYMESGNLKAALADFDKVVEMAPEAAESYNNRGVAYLQLKQFDQALADFSTAILRQPDDLKAFLNRSLARQVTGDVAGAVTDLSHVILKSPKSPGPYLQRGRLYVSQKEHEKAIADFTEAIVILPETSAVAVEAYRDRAKAHKAAGKDAAAASDEAEADRLEGK